MTTLIDAAKQALGCLVRANAMYGQPNEDAQQALRAAIQEAEQQEPVARFVRIEYYTQPQAAKEWQGLTASEINDACEDAFGKSADTYDLRVFDFARAIEAKLKEKNCEV